MKPSDEQPVGHLSDEEVIRRLQEKVKMEDSNEVTRLEKLHQELEDAKTNLIVTTFIEFGSWVEEERRPVTIYPPGWVDPDAWVVKCEREGVPPRRQVKGVHPVLAFAMYEMLWKAGRVI